jgi:hypothetical protein
MTEAEARATIAPGIEPSSQPISLNQQATNALRRAPAAHGSRDLSRSAEVEACAPPDLLKHSAQFE